VSLHSRVAELEERIAPALPVALVWLDWWGTEGGVAIDGRTFLRTNDETLQQLADRAVKETRADYPGSRLVVMSWRRP